ncbi:MAG: response regulator [Lachnospiraceae bacterium]|nr:response regulator [Lachnospiraceae bacterium]
MADWIAVVDDDIANLKVAGRVLSRNQMQVSALKSGLDLLEFMKTKSPDLILLDIKMPDPDGFETLKRLREWEDINNKRETPVIFLTAEDDTEAEAKGLLWGAMDYIRKPFVPEVLVLRVQHILELQRLKRNLESEVEKKTQENELLAMQVVKTLADTIDAKDAYTNGHSSRVAEYASEIARRFGYSNNRVDKIYMMGLLHDVGKIGVPDEVINKPAKLTDEEFEMIKAHPAIGANILENITAMPELSIGARWHHERYDGKGYPDGLKGDDIPEEARIIAVADAYDAMTSNRSYRGYMPQEKVREQLVSGRGTQFDPKFAEIMLEIMDEDIGYHMREH